jgi:GNAT superfamily N-acetyltransferase
MSGVIVVRPYVPDDATEVIARWHETNTQAYPYVAEHQRHTLDDARRYFARELVPRCALLVAERDGLRAALMALDGCWIRQLAVFADHRRHGVGRALLDAARTASPDELRLFTFERNVPARAFYEADGFVAVRFGRSPPPEDEPDVEYRWSGH